MSSMMEALASIEEQRAKRLLFLPCWTLKRWNQANELGGGLDANVKHNVVDILALTTFYRSVAREEEGGLAFYPVTKEEYQWITTSVKCTVVSRGKNGMLENRCGNKAEWRHPQRRKHEVFCDKCKNIITGIFPKSGKWEKIEGG